MVAKQLASELDAEYEIIMTMITTLIRKLNNSMDDMRVNIREKNIKKISRQLHSFSGLSGNLQMFSLASLITDMAKSVRNEDWEMTETLFDELSTFLNDIVI